MVPPTELVIYLINGAYQSRRSAPRRLPPVHFFIGRRIKWVLERMHEQ
jgi:hypothetical protein